MVLLLNGLISANQIITAGIVITAFSLLLYALTFNLRERVARTFAILLTCVTAVYFCDAVVSTLREAGIVEAWLRLQWVGIAFIPVTYLHFSDALLATTGQPSRGRRRQSIYILYITATVFLVAAVFTNILVYAGSVQSGAAYLLAGPLFAVFLVYFLGTLSWAGWNFWRAYRRCQTSTTRRRMIYLMVSAAAPAIGTFPFLLFTRQTAIFHPLIFWFIVVATNTAVATLLVVMAYSVAYIGVTLPDRIIKGRLFQWLLRGPVVASMLLTVFVFVSRYGPRLEVYDSRALPFFLVGTVLLLQFVITLIRLPLERALFYGSARGELRRLQILEERLLTPGDLRQFLESVLAGVCDALRCPAAFLVAFGQDGKIEYEVSVGARPPNPIEWPPLDTLHAAQVVTSPAAEAGGAAQVAPITLFGWGDYWLAPLHQAATGEPLGLLGLRRAAEATTPVSPEDLLVLSVLAARAASALEDRRLQQEVSTAVDRLLPRMETIQRLRAAATYAGIQSVSAGGNVASDPDLAQLVKDALSHYWGGPKLTSSPLLRLRVVEQALHNHDDNPANALRAVLKEAIERLKPDGQRKFTTEWILYNILEMKFLQNRRVREVAMRLAVSEADLYRKQRVAIEEVAQAIRLMEQEAGEKAPTQVSHPE
jgi:hypothetical protein